MTPDILLSEGVGAVLPQDPVAGVRAVGLVIEGACVVLQAALPCRTTCHISNSLKYRMHSLSCTCMSLLQCICESVTGHEAWQHSPKCAGLMCHCIFCGNAPGMV